MPVGGPLQLQEQRRYRMLGVIGKGGFGKVYRARLEGPAGFVKDVAVKLLSDEQAPEEVLRRFRDESRILGLVRDRAIVSVDPPTRLGGRWAVVMEYVEGASCAQVLRSVGRFPPRPALEVVAEVARALDALYRQPGPDGEPLRVLHRDLKPQNLQLMPSGQVKILDFGIARAEFANREAATTVNIGGTVGYIAPERLLGEEGPAGDVYSLGVVLRALVTGQRPSRRDRPDSPRGGEEATGPGGPPPGPELAPVLALADRMASVTPEERPTAAEVEELCASLAESFPPPGLRRWAEKHVPAIPGEGADDLVGSLLTDVGSAAPEFTGDVPAPARRGPPWRLLAALVALVALGGALAGAAVLATGVGVVAFSGASSGPAAPPPGGLEAPEPVVAGSVTAPEPPPPPAPAEPAPAEPAPPAEVAEPPAVAAKPPPAPAKPPPAPAPAPAGPQVALLLSSVPMGAEVWIDGHKVGVTPVVDLPVGVGTHTVKMVRGAETLTRTLKVSERGPTRFVWSGGDQWEAQY